MSCLRLSCRMVP
uniref:Uncharacterized protein n=1 Tax=Anguilla anguilla TaxID=7936 RepID=A0A0E9VSA0_ANGAN